MSLDYRGNPAFFRRYPFMVTQHIKDFEYNINCWIEPAASKSVGERLTWSKNIQYPRDPITRTTTNIEFRFTWDGWKWNISTFNESD